MLFSDREREHQKGAAACDAYRVANRLGQLPEEQLNGSECLKVQLIWNVRLVSGCTRFSLSWVTYVICEYGVWNAFSFLILTTSLLPNNTSNFILSHPHNSYPHILTPSQLTPSHPYNSLTSSKPHNLTPTPSQPHTLTTSYPHSQQHAVANLWCPWWPRCSLVTMAMKPSSLLNNSGCWF